MGIGILFSENTNPHAMNKQETEFSIQSSQYL
jgi:hypothetical protein